MTHTANHSVPEQGKLRRALAAAWVFLQSMESTSFDYTLDRIERLEREVGRLKEEVRQSRDPGAVDAHNASRPMQSD
jgi:HAMP domain-containing protein